MKTAKITAQLALAGKIAVQLDIDITDHQARELLDAIATTLNNDKWSDGNVTRVEKDKLSLTRKSKDDLDQQTIDFPAEERPVVLQGEFQVIEMEEQKMLGHNPRDLTSDPDPQHFVKFATDYECPACGETIPAGETLVLDEEYYQTKQMITYTCTECADEYPDEEGAE